MIGYFNGEYFLKSLRILLHVGPSISFQRLGVMRSHFTEFFFGYEFSYILSLSLLNVDVINIICFLYCLLCNHCKTTFNVAKKRKL